MNGRQALLLVVGFMVAASALGADEVAPPTVPRLQALKLQVINGDVPAYISSDVNRTVAGDLAQKIAQCRALVTEAGNPPIALAILNADDWKRATPLPYGMPHNSSVESPYVVVIPSTWQNAPPMLAADRDVLAKSLGTLSPDRYVHLLALHEAGHVLTYGILGLKGPDATYERWPFWYGEFVANYFSTQCNASRRGDDSFVRRGESALAAIPRAQYVTLDDWDRLMNDTAPSGQPYVMTPEGGLNFGAFQGLTAELSNVVFDAAPGERFIKLLREQWARPGRRSTNELLNDLSAIAPGVREWVIERKAIRVERKE